MTLTLSVPKSLAQDLQRKANEQQRSVEEVALDLLAQAIDEDNHFPTPEEVVARIQALPPDPRNIRPAEGSLADALRNAPHDPNFNLEEWEQEWAIAEAEIRAMNRAISRC